MLRSLGYQATRRVKALLWIKRSLLYNYRKEMPRRGYSHPEREQERNLLTNHNDQPSIQLTRDARRMMRDTNDSEEA